LLLTNFEVKKTSFKMCTGAALTQ